ncbi:hypothetical protein [Kibdelosporangium phytohabitans]|nr:hypothetical protein [Kibdelosporangium phytohabitans]MBE1468080.1 hypothetical protein [Kibdelosporangium phytohabitans]
MVLSDKSFRVLVTTWGWSSRYTTDGFIPESVWHKRASPKVRKELEPGLVHRPGHACPRCPVVPEGHVRMHDYLEHQRSADEIEDLKATKQRAGRLGNHQRWHHGHGVIDPGCEFCVPNGSQDRSHVRSQKDRTSDPTSDRKTVAEGSQNDRKTIAETDTDKRSTSSVVTSRKRSNLTARADRGTGAREQAEILAETAHTLPAHRLVEAYAKTCNRRPPRKVLTELAQQVDALLAEDWPPELVTQALDAWGAKGMHPKALPSVAHEVANKTRGTPGSGGYRSATDTAIEDFLKRGNQTPARAAIEGSTT